MVHDIGKTIMIIALVLFAVGAAVHLGGRFLPFGRLPGDFVWQGKNWSIHFPLASSIVVSVILTVLVNLFFRR